jgi:hypothetical protein
MDEVNAFDLWLKRVLEDRYGRAAREPVPDELLRLFDQQPSEH